MNQGRIWCVVNPTVGLPLFLGGVATISLLVHASVMTHTDWMGRFFEGGKAKTAENNVGGATSSLALAPQAQGAFSITVTPTAAKSATGETAFVVTVTPTAGAAQTTQLAANDGTPADAASATKPPQQ